MSFEIVDRCCFECGEHFDGYPEDDMCVACWDDYYGGV